MVALFFVLAIVIVVAASAVVLRGRFDALVGEIRTDRGRLEAHWVAEGALEHARWALARDPAYTGGRVPVGGGEADVSVTAGPGADQVRVVVDAMVKRGAAGAAARRVEARLRLGPGLPRIEEWSASR